MSNLGYDPEAPSADEMYAELIKQAQSTASAKRFKSALFTGLAVGYGIFTIKSGAGVESSISSNAKTIATSAVPAAMAGLMAVLGVNSAIRSIHSGSEAAALKAFHHHDMYLALKAEEQAQEGGPGQPPEQPQ